MSNHGKDVFPLKHVQSQERHRREMAREARRKQLRSEKKNQPKPPRRKNYVPAAVEAWDELDELEFERIMPRGERERRKTVAQSAFRQNGRAAAVATEEIEGTRGLVVEVSSALCRVEVNGERLLCRIRGALTAQPQEFTNVVAVGDEVIISEDGTGGGIVEAVLPRRSILARPDVFHSHLRQVIVANADQLLIVAAWRDPLIWLELIDRYLIAAERSGLAPIICVNKIDLADDEEALEETLAPYRRLGYRVVLTSAATGAGIDELRGLLEEKISVLAGLSGVGKSSLLSTVQPGLQLRTGEVSSSKKHQGEGRHTTTQATLLALADGGSVIDTPGIREFGLSGLRRQELADHFPELAELGDECRFANCTHHDEPECAVLAALEAGQVAESRYHSYRQIYASLPA